MYPNKHKKFHLDAEKNGQKNGLNSFLLKMFVIGLEFHVILM